MTIAQLHSHFLNSKGICTDTRNLQRGQIYFALKGKNFNGNTFASRALEQGAQLVIIDEKKHISEGAVVVENVLTTLQELATYHREYLNIPIIGLTGSNGKTTTKELIYSVLSKKHKTTATLGNLNNHIGVPLTLLSMTPETEIGIVEMGANHQKEIALLAEIAKPTLGYITNFGKAHLEGFGGIEGVIKGKSELYDYLRGSQNVALINNLDPLQVKQSEGTKKITFGSPQSDYPIAFTSANPTVVLQVDHREIKSKLVGNYNFSNIAAAVAIGIHFSVALKDVKEAIQSYTPTNNRSQIIHCDNYSIILDAYNANPSSMVAALNHLSSQQRGARIAFLGDMFEVGATTSQEHQNILRLANQLNIDTIFAVGPTFGKMKPLSNTQKLYSSYDAFAKAYFHKIPQGATILIKGSRGMKMERVIDLIKKQ